MPSKKQSDEIRKSLLKQIASLPKKQAEEWKEKIKSMKSEELEKFNSQKQGKKQCLFCQISKGLVETKKVYEDDRVLAFLDIMPAKLGQVIIIPRQHYQFMFQMPDDLLDHIFDITSLLEEIVVNVTKSNGVNIIINQGETAGQNVPHFAINLVPRTDNDGLNFNWPRNPVDKEELEEIAKEISERIKKDLEVKEKESEKLEVKEEKVEEAIEEEKDEAELILRHVGERLP